MSFYKKLIFVFLIILFSAVSKNATAENFAKAPAAKFEQNPINIIKALFADAKEGDWILTQTKKKYCVKTKVISKSEDELVIETENIVKDKLQSTAYQKIDLKNNYIKEARITDIDGTVTEIDVNKLLLNQISVTKFAKVEEGVKVKVPAGKFICDKYKAIADDKVVYFWLNDSIPVNKLVKAKIKHSVSKLKDYSGKTA